MASKALLNVDYTYDFVAEKGNLTCGKPGQEIEHAIVRLTKEFIEAGDYVVLAIDKHSENDELHPEMKLFPPHNIEGTYGRDLYGSLADLYNQHKNDSNIYYMDKTRYSAFAGTDLEMKLRERGIEEVHICGVCTDICVLHTAIDAYNKGFAIIIHADAVASFNEAGHEWALGHFTNTLGALVLRTGN
ncbi:cysteine hydrolase family protein [Bacillus sp. FSL K6-3431]|uniref:cysteine hydrolase family protein n=1 Tax=Bacillus sp. FSL K6-3431 TaxID=2921500 RepID=UPI0030F9F511